MAIFGVPRVRYRSLRALDIINTLALFSLHVPTSSASKLLSCSGLLSSIFVSGKHAELLPGNKLRPVDLHRCGDDENLDHRNLEATVLEGVAMLLCESIAGIL